MIFSSGAKWSSDLELINGPVRGKITVVAWESLRLKRARNGQELVQRVVHFKFSECAPLRIFMKIGSFGLVYFHPQRKSFQRLRVRLVSDIFAATIVAPQSFAVYFASLLR
jgi:hypothetical protein